MKIIHDSRDINYRSPFGAVEVGSEVELSVDVIGAEVREAVLQIRRDEEAGFTQVQMTETSVDQSPDGADQSPDGADQSPDGTEQSSAVHRVQKLSKYRRTAA